MSVSWSSAPLSDSELDLVIMTHVDDCMAVRDPEIMSKVADMIKSQYSIQDLGFPANYLGLQLTRTPEYLELTCRTLIL